MSGQRWLSVIVVNWNVRDLLRDCLESLRTNIGLPQDSYEVIVVDNASRDGSVDMLRAEFPEVSLIASDTNLGFGKGCNLGYASAAGGYIWLLNPDTLVPKDAVPTLLAAMESNPRLGILGPRLLNGDGSFQRASGGAFPSLRNVAWNYLFLNRLLPGSWAPAPLFLKDDPQGTFDVDWVSGAAMMVRRESVGERIFDESFFMFGEDMDVCDRVRREGWEVKYTSACSVVHFHGQSFDRQTEFEVVATAHKGPRRFFCKHHKGLAPVVYDAVLMLGYLIRWPLYGLLAMFRPRRGYGAMSNFSRQYLKTMVVALWTRR